MGFCPRHLARCTSDPGIPGVGTATAAKLLVKWGNLTSLLDNKDKVALMKFRGASRVAELLQQHEETIRLARELTGLIVDPSLSIELSDYEIKPDDKAMQTTFDKLGFSDKRRQRWYDLLEQKFINA